METTPVEKLDQTTIDAMAGVALGAWSSISTVVIAGDPSYHLYFVEKRNEERLKTFEECVVGIRTRLESERRERFLTEVTQKILDETPVVPRAVLFDDKQEAERRRRTRR